MVEQQRDVIESDLARLNDALARLEESISFEDKQIPARLNIDAAIQRFEFTYELSWKLIQKTIRSEGGDCFSPKDCLRKAAQYRLIADPNKWIDYLEARNLTVHTYDQNTADQIYELAKRFVDDVKSLTKTIEERVVSFRYR